MLGNGKQYSPLVTFNRTEHKLKMLSSKLRIIYNIPNQIKCKEKIIQLTNYIVNTTTAWMLTKFLNKY